ncbi:MAG: lipopolysaccharide assembly protein LapA domain-containing protein [Phycisphaerae bacterium]
MKHVKIIAAAVLAILAIVVFVQNTEQVQTRILFMTVTMSRALLLLVTLLLGFVLGVLAGWHFRPKPKSEE